MLLMCFLVVAIAGWIVLAIFAYRWLIRSLCPKCHTYLHKNSKYCPTCGKEVVALFKSYRFLRNEMSYRCLNCRANVRAVTNFCELCGKDGYIEPVTPTLDLIHHYRSRWRNLMIGALVFVLVWHFIFLLWAVLTGGL